MHKFESESFRTNINIIVGFIAWIVILMVCAYFKIDAALSVAFSLIAIIGIIFDFFIRGIEKIWFIPAKVHYFFTGRKIEKSEEKDRQLRREAFERSVKQDEVNSFVKTMRGK